MQNFGRFSTTCLLALLTLTANASGTGQDIENRKDIWSPAIPSAFDEKGPVNFGPLTNGLEFHVSLDPLKCTFLADYISAHRGCCAMKFLHALDIDQALIVHTEVGRGSPPQKKKINRENLKFVLKFSVLVTITSGLVGISPQNIFHTTCHEAGVITLV